MSLESAVHSFAAEPRMLFFLSGLFIVLTSVFILSLCRLKTIPAALIGFYLVSAAQIIVLFEIASLFHSVNQKGFILVGNLAFLVVSSCAWLIAGRPKLIDSALWKSRMGKVLSTFRDNPAVIVFGCFILAAYVYAAYLIINVPQNVDDILAAYLARVGFWLQYGSFLPWPTSNYSLPQIAFPANPQILVLWTVLFSGTDQLAGFIQWTVSIIAILAIYGLCRQLKQGMALSIFTAFLFITIPAAALQLSTAQTDLMATAFFICGVYLIYSGWKNDRPGEMLLSALSFALGVGTKQTVLFAAPGAAILFLLLFLKFPDGKWKKTGLFAGGLAAFIVLVGSYFYIQNFVFFGKILGPATVEETYTGLQNVAIIGRLVMGIGNAAQFFLSSFFSEFFAGQVNALISLNPPLLGSVTEFSELIVTYSSGTIGILVTYLLVFGIWAGFKKIRSDNEPLAAGLLAAGAVYFLIICFIRQYSASIFRYLLISIALFMPLIGEGEYFKSDSKSRLAINERLIGVIVISLLILGWTLTADKAKSLYTQVALPGMNRTAKQLVLMPEFANTYLYIDELIPADASIGLVGDGKYPISPLFGKYYTRRLKQIVPPEDNHITLDKNEPLDFLLVDSILLQGDLTIPDGYKKLTTRNDFTIYQRVK
jgi:4-amino-4-deoxy-L-arabinose transferase-like glycosyltransferase